MKLVLLLLRWLDTDRCSQRREAGVFGGIQLMVGRGTMPPAVSMTLPLDVAPLMIPFLGAINDVEEAF